MVHTTGYILYNLATEKYIGREPKPSSPHAHRWVEEDPLFLCESGLDMIFNINTTIPRSRLPSMSAKEFNEHIARIRTETKHIKKFLRGTHQSDQIMVIPVDIKDQLSYDIDFVNAFKLQ